MAQHYPIFLNLAGARCVVVGGGPVAARKAAALEAAGARVTAVAPSFCSAFDGLECVERLAKPYEASAVSGARVVIAATDQAALNEEVSRDARAAGALVNVVDAPGMCDFIVPATVARGELVLAVSTGGACPALAARIRRELEQAYPEVYAEFVALLREVRGEVLGMVDAPARRRAILDRLSGPEFLGCLLAEGPRTAMRRMQRFVAEEIDEADARERAGRSEECASSDAHDAEPSDSAQGFRI